MGNAVLTQAAVGHEEVAGGEGDGGSEDRVSDGAAMWRVSGEGEARTA